MIFLRLLARFAGKKKLLLLYLTLFNKYNIPKLYYFKKTQKKKLIKNKRQLVVEWRKISMRMRLTVLLRRLRLKKSKQQWDKRGLLSKFKKNSWRKNFKQLFKRFKFRKKHKLLRLSKKLLITKNNNFNSRIFFYKKYFIQKNLTLIGELLSNYNNFIMRTHDFIKIIDSFEKKKYNKQPVVTYSNNLKQYTLRRIHHKRKRRRHFWSLRFRRRRRFRKFKWILSKNILLFYLSSFPSFNLEKLLILLLNKNRVDYSVILRLKGVKQLCNVPKFNHLYLYLGNRDLEHNPPFYEQLINSIFKVRTRKTSKKKLLKSFLRTTFLKKARPFKKLKSIFVNRNLFKNKYITNNFRRFKYRRKKRTKRTKWSLNKSRIDIFTFLKEEKDLSAVHFDKNDILVRSDKNKPFIILNIGLFITSKLTLSNLQFNHFKYKFRFKKKYFSFLAPNQLKKSILIIKSRIVISRFFLKNKRKFSLSKFKNFSNKNFLLTFTSFFRNHIQKSQQTMKYNFNLNSHILYSKAYNQLGLESSDRYGEVFIPRIRFKPGYQRLWRIARTALKEALRLNYRYQYRLTRYLMGFSRKINSYFLYYSENTLERVIMYSKLLPDLNSLDFFVNQSAVYLNGKMVYNTKRIIYVNDLIQLIVSQWFYAFYRWLFNWTTIRIRKFRRLVYRKGLAYKYKLMKTKKTKSRYTPNWIFNVRYDLIDVRPNLEVDYFTLSVFYLYEPYITQNYPINELSETRHHIYRLYNWKYIT